MHKGTGAAHTPTAAPAPHAASHQQPQQRQDSTADGAGQRHGATSQPPAQRASYSTLGTTALLASTAVSPSSSGHQSAQQRPSVHPTASIALSTAPGAAAEAAREGLGTLSPLWESHQQPGFVLRATKACQANRAPSSPTASA